MTIPTNKGESEPHGLIQAASFLAAMARGDLVTIFEATGLNRAHATAEADRCIGIASTLLGDMEAHAVHAHIQNIELDSTAELAPLGLRVALLEEYRPVVEYSSPGY